MKSYLSRLLDFVPFFAIPPSFKSAPSSRYFESDIELDYLLPSQIPTTSATMGGAGGGAGLAPVAGAEKFFSKQNLRPLFFCMLATLGAFSYGYDGQYWASCIQMPRFLRDFGVQGPDGVYFYPSNEKSYSTSIVQAGEFAGALVAGPVGDFLGRRGTFHAASLCLIIGALLQIIVVGSVGLLTGGRAILGMGIGLLANTTPLYLSEISTVAIRGVVVGSWQLLLAIGQVIGAVVGQATSKREDTGAWRIPIAVIFALALCLITIQFIIPESPRWLVNKGKDDKAIKALYKLNKDQQDPEAIVQIQLRSFQEAKREEEELGKDSGWKSLFTRKEELRKLMIVCGVLSAQQINGVQFIFSYTTNFFAVATGTSPTDTDKAFIYTIIVTVIEVVGVIFSFGVVNRFGRRPLLIWTSIPMFASLFIMAALGAIHRQRTQVENNVVVAMICIFVFFFNVAWGPLAWVVASECAVGANRQKLMSLGSACFFLWAFIVAFTLPYLFDADKANLGTQIGWIYGVGTILGILFTYSCVPETSGRTLEEIAEMINARVPTRKWTTYITSVDRDGMNGLNEDQHDATILSKNDSDSEDKKVNKNGEKTSVTDADENPSNGDHSSGMRDLDSEERQ